MRYAPKPTLPWEPIEAVIRGGRPVCQGAAGYCWDTSHRTCVSAEQVAEALGISERSVNRYRSLGKFPAEHADRFAVTAGRHPIEIWGQEWEQVAA